MTAEAAIWTPELWVPGIGWRPKPLPKFSLRAWRKAKEDTLVQALAVPHVGGNKTTSAANIVSDSWTSTAGSLIVVIGHIYNANAAASGSDVVDSKSNTYTLVVGAYPGTSNAGIAIFYNSAGTRGASHTVTFNTGLGGGTSNNIAVVEITGQSASPLDSTTFKVQRDTSGSSPWNITAAAAISGNQICIYGVTIDTGTVAAPFTNPTGYTNIINQNDGSTALVSYAGYKINETGTPTVGASSAHTLGVNRETAIATFKELAGAAGFIRPKILRSNTAVMSAGNR